MLNNYFVIQDFVIQNLNNSDILIHLPKLKLHPILNTN